jgi:hypothetical protein
MTLSKTLQAKISKDKEIEKYIKLLQENQTEIFMYNYNLNYNSAMESKKMDLKTYIDEYHPYLAVDDDLVQRIFDRWLPASIQSYLIDLVTGNAVKDLILIADIQSIVDEIEEQLENTDEDDIQKINALNESYNYFQQFLEDGKKYLLIDGKHRDDVIEGFFFPGTPGRTLEEKVIFTDARFADLFIDSKTNLPQNVIGKSFQQLPDALQNDIYKRPILVTIIKTGDIKRLQQHFVSTNSGLKLFPMEIRICSMSDVARFVREITNKELNPNNWLFFNEMDSLKGSDEKSILKKGHLLLLSNLINYYLHLVKDNSSKDFTTSDALDNLFSYDFSLSSDDKSKIKDIVKSITIGGFEVYTSDTKSKKASKKKKTQKLIRWSWSDYVNMFILYSNALTGKTWKLNNDKKVVEILQPKLFCDSMLDIVRDLEERDYFVVDADGNIQQVFKPQTNKMVNYKNPHSFAAANSNHNKENMNKKHNMLSSEFDIRLESLIEAGVIRLIEKKRTENLKNKRISATKSGKKDAFTGAPLTWGQIDSGKTVNAHIEAHSGGGTEMVVGLSKPNAYSKTETLYSEKIKNLSTK